MRIGSGAALRPLFFLQRLGGIACPLEPALLCRSYSATTSAIWSRDRNAAAGSIVLKQRLQFRTWGQSEVGQILKTAAEVITGVYLISAFDIAKKHLPPPGDLPMKPELIILDSGGYEVSDESDLSEVMRPEAEASSWSVRELETVLDGWPDSMPAIFVSYDHFKERKSFAKQISGARELFRKRRAQLQLLSDQAGNRRANVAGAGAENRDRQADELTSFDVIGLTEKGLGKSPLQRMVRIARLRRALDEAKVVSPIHIFGSLDPVSTTLYFLAGAEIFDGLTWLRYAFVKDTGSLKDQCAYIHGFATFEHGVHMDDKNQRLRVVTDNYYYLLDLTERLKHFESTGDFPNCRIRSLCVTPARSCSGS